MPKAAFVSAALLLAALVLLFPSPPLELTQASLDTYGTEVEPEEQAEGAERWLDSRQSDLDAAARWNEDE